MVRLVPMTEAEFQAYLASAVQEYAAEKVAAGTWVAERAQALSAETYQKLLPAGLASPDQYVFSIFDAADVHVGSLWFAKVDWGAGPMAFIYDFVIFKQFRRQGYGAQALAALDAEVLAHGLTTIHLHVFGHNNAARQLYEKMGYGVTDVNMAKHLTPSIS